MGVTEDASHEGRSIQILYTLLPQHTRDNFPLLNVLLHNRTELRGGMQRLLVITTLYLPWIAIL